MTADVQRELAEEWRPVVGYEGLYEVSDQGHVRSLSRNGRPALILKPTISGKGYPRVNLWGERRLTRTVHLLVLSAFVGPRPDGTEIRHLDGNKLNPSLANLVYGTTSENVLDQVKHGVHNNARKTHCSRGHAYEGDNVGNICGRRRCRTCHNEDCRLRRARAAAMRGAA